MTRNNAIICDENGVKYAQINAHRVCFEQFGKGKDIVFLHGWGASRSAFLFVAKRLCFNYRVTVLDFAGFGDSQTPSEPYTVPKYADDVLKLLNICGIERATLVGHSFGGRVATEIAVRCPSVVERLVLIDSAGIKPRRKPSYYIKIALHKILKKFFGKGLRGSSDYAVLSDEMKKTFINVVGYDQRNDICRISQPTAVFWGKKDKETPLYMYRYYLKHVKQSEGFLLDGGHFSYVDDYAKFMAILLAYLKETD